MNHITKKILLAGLFFSLAFVPSAQAGVTEDLKVKIEVLQKQLLQLQREEAGAKINPAVVSISIHKPTEKFRVIWKESSELGKAGHPVYEFLGGPATEVIGGGTGFIIDNQGYVLTNNHVVPTDTVILMITLSSGSTREAKIIYRDVDRDIAILKMEGINYPTLTLGDSDILQTGEQLIAIGNASGKNINVPVVGTISQLNQTVVIEDKKGKEKNLENLIQTNIRVTRGYSGSPLCNLDGEVIGIIVATADGAWRPVTFALPINPIKPIIERVLGK